MEAQFSITTEAASDLVRITMAGFFSEDDVQRFATARNAAHRELTGAPGEHVSLVDIRGMKIQSQATVSAFAAILADPTTWSRRIAFVSEGGLARAQLARASGGRGRLFQTIAEAEAWLRAPDAMQRVA